MIGINVINIEIIIKTELIILLLKILFTNSELILIIINNIKAQRI